QGSAAEALGLIGDIAAADAIARMVAQIVQTGGLAQAGDDDPMPDTAAATFRLGVYALVRLKAFDQVASAVLDSAGQPLVRSWPVAFALQRIENPRALTALLSLAKESHPYTRAFAAIDPEGFVMVLSSLDADPHWSVRAALASLLGTLPSETALPRLTTMLGDSDQRVLPSVLASLVRLKAPDVTTILLDRLKAD